VTARLPSLIAITPGDGRPLKPWIEALGHAGLRGLLIREPSLDAPTLEDLVRYSQDHVASVLVHGGCAGHAHLACSGLHLASHAFLDPLPLKQQGWLGVSTHNAQELEDAFARGADYVFLSPVGKPISKPKDQRQVLGISGFLNIAGRRPVYALGGITPSICATLMNEGAFGVAVMGDLFGCASPDQAEERLKAYGEAVSD
jgi:thiamine monophosphate synthase